MNEFEAPDPIGGVLRLLHERLAALTSGEVATYIPELGTADPSWFGIALSTLDGHVYEAGDVHREFTIQSVSKPFVYALALADRGLDEVLRRVGVEPSGEAFNSIRLDSNTGRPLNPMVNAGAIVTASLADGGTADERFARIRSGLSEFAGRELEVDDRVYASESHTGDHNRALAYLMHGTGALRCGVEDALRVYFGQCSVLVTAHDLAVMAATIAAGGVHPVTGRVVVSPAVAQHVLTVMATCGTYDYAGEWLLRVGMPAKSGVSGAMAAALPAQFGLGVFSPPLDSRGNSVRAIAVCEELSARFGMHMMRRAVRSVPAFARLLHGDDLRSDRERPARERRALTEHGRRILVCELQSDMGFVGAETVLRAIGASLAGVEWLVLDLNRVARLESVAVAMLDAFTADLAGRGVRLVVADPWQRALLTSAITETSTLSAALEHCEDELLGECDLVRSAAVPAAEQDILRDLAPARAERLAELMRMTDLDAGDEIRDLALGLVIRGRLEGRGDGGRHATAVAGAAFGPLTLLEPVGLQWAAVAPSTCLVLTRDARIELADQDPATLAALQEAIAHDLAERLRETAFR
ncbi:MAG TPA: glutaminase A [Streptosporangiaceae bacterium]|nr:glutaminase A [Streptosporangiaceae bacterium]